MPERQIRAGKKTQRQIIGAEAEAYAATMLEEQGLQILQRNFRVRGGEIDLICADHNEVVFVEVRSRAPSHYGDAADSIDAKKRARIILAARLWLQRQKQYRNACCRFDCVFFDGETRRWLRNAFTAD